MQRGISFLAVALLAAACTTESTAPGARASALGSTPSLDLSAAGSDKVIDGFTAGSVSLAACGSPVWSFFQDASINGGARELYVREAGSCRNGGNSQARFDIDATAGTASWHGVNPASSEQRLAYGTEIGQTFRFNNSPNKNKGTPLHLALHTTDKLRIDMKQVYAGGPGVTLVLRDGASRVYSQTVVPVAGTNLYALSSFPGMTAAGAAEIDGISIQGFGFRDPGYVYSLISIQGSDNTPPVITPTVTGSVGNDNWYTSDVSVSWSVTDPDSPITSSTGCDAASVTTDTDGQTFTCSATSAGGTSQQSVTVKRDATLPTVSYTGNAGSYGVDQDVSITCSAADATKPGSGLASTTCQDITGPAYGFAIGNNSYSATALDNAGNTGNGATSFNVVVTPDGLCALTERWATKGGTAHSLCVKLQAAAASAARGDRDSEAGQLGAYANELSAQSGKGMPADKAAILLSLVNQL